VDAVLVVPIGPYLALGLIVIVVLVVGRRDN
jgi:hypothetical protein